MTIDDDIPVGHFETHSMDGLMWRTTQKVRDLFNDQDVLPTVQRYTEERDNQIRARQLDPSEDTLTMNYLIKETEVEITQHAWQSIPTVTLKPTSAQDLIE